MGDVRVFVTGEEYQAFITDIRIQIFSLKKKKTGIILGHDRISYP